MAQSEELKFILKMKDEATKVLRETGKALKESGLVAAEAEKKIRAKTKATKEEALAAQAADKAIRRTIAALKELSREAGSVEKSLKKQTAATKAEGAAAQAATAKLVLATQAVTQHGNAASNAAGKVTRIAQATQQQGTAASQATPALRQLTQAMTQQARAAQQAAANAQRQTTSTQQAGRAARQARQEMRDLAQAALELGAAYAAFQAAGAQIRNIFGPYMQLEDIFVQVAKTTGMAGAELDSFKSGFRELAATMTVPIEQLGEAAVVAGQLGITGKDDILAFTEVVAKLGTATDINGEMAAQAIARLLKVTGEGPGRIREFASSLAALGNNSAATESQIMRLASEIARSTANMSGVDSPQILAIAATLKEMDQQAELTGSAIGRIALVMNDTAALGGKQLDSLATLTGKSMEEVRRQIKGGLVDSLTLFTEALAESEAQTGSTSAMLDQFELNTVEIRKVIQPLLANLDSLTQKTELSRQAWIEANTLNAEYAVASQRLSAQLNLLSNNFTLLGEAMGESLSEEAKGLVKSLTGAVRGLTESFRALPEGVQESIAAIAVLGPTIVAVLVALRALSTALAFAGFNAANAAMSFAALRTALTALFGLLRAHPLGALATALGVVAAAVYMLDTNFDGLREAVQRNNDILAQYGATAEDVTEKLKTLNDQTVETLRLGYERQMQDLEKLRTKLRESVANNELEGDSWFGSSGQGVFRPVRGPDPLAAPRKQARDLLADFKAGKLAAQDFGNALRGISLNLQDGPLRERIDQMVQALDQEARYAEEHDVVKGRRDAVIREQQGRRRAGLGGKPGAGGDVRPVMSDSLRDALKRFEDDAADAGLDMTQAQIASVTRQAEELKKKIRAEMAGAPAPVIEAELAKVDAQLQQQIAGITAKARDKIGKGAEKMTREIAEFVGKGTGASMTEVERRIFEVNRDAGQLIANAREAGASTQELASIRVSAEQQIAAIRKEQAAKRDKALGDSGFDITQVREEVEALGKGAEAYDRYKLAKQRATDLKQFSEGLRDPELGISADEIKALVDEYDKLLSRREEALPLYEKEKQAQEDLKDRINDVKDAFADMATDIIFEAKSIGEALSGLAEELAKMVFTRSVMDPMANWLSAGISTGMSGDGIGSTAATLFGLMARQGQAFDRGHVQKFAKGGLVSGPTMFGHKGGMGLMGEAGTEAIMPLTRMSDGELGVRMAGGGGGSTVINAPVTITIQGGSSGNQDDDYALAKKVGASVQQHLRALVVQQLQEQMRPGNMLNPVGAI